MISIPQSLKDFYSDDDYYIVANDRPCQSILLMLSDAPVDKDMEEFIAREQRLYPESNFYQLDNFQPAPVAEPEAEQSTLKQQIKHLKKTAPQKSYSKSDFNADAIIRALRWHMDLISTFVIGREDIIRQIIFAILTGEHVLLLSRTGMAKSYLVNAIFSIFEGARVFASQASKDQTPDNYFGPYNMEEFRKGKIRHNIKGSVIESNLVFLDEFFDASDVVLRSLLSVLNERKFINGQEQIDASIHTAIATANYMRTNEVTEAILDRFTYKAIIPEVNNTYTQLMIDRTYQEMRGQAVEPEQKIFFDQIRFLHHMISDNSDTIIEIPDYIYFLKNVIVNKFTTEMRQYNSTFFVSPRKQAKLSDFLRASALFNGREEVNLDDLQELHLALCTLNSFVTIKTVEKEEKDVYLEAYHKTMTHFKSTGALEQIEFLLNVRYVFEDIRSNPDRKEAALDSANNESLLERFRDLLPGRKKKEDKRMTISNLKQSINALVPAVEEVHDLKNGILKEYHTLT